MKQTTVDLSRSSLDLGGVTHIMGVINVSPDSKNTHTVALSVEDALRMADRYRAWGATLIDVGGQSSHYDNPTIDSEDESGRVVPVVEALVAEGHVISIDTWKPEVARDAVAVGAEIINDTGGLADPAMRKVVRDSGAVAIAVRVEGTNPHAVGAVEIRDDKAKITKDEFEVLLDDLERDQISNVILDPGIALNYRGNYEDYTRLQLQVIQDSAILHELGKPVLIPIPRKRDFHWVAAYVALALEHEADIIRVHDVAMAAGLARLFGRVASISR